MRVVSQLRGMMTIAATIAALLPLALVSTLVTGLPVNALPGGSSQAWVADCREGSFACGEPTLERLRSMPSQVRVGDRTYKLEVEVWRDFMPGPGRSERPLLTLLRVMTTGKEPVAPDLGVDAMWVIQGRRMWKSQRFDGPRMSEESMLELMHRQGPPLQPGSQVDVVVQLRDGQGKRYWLRSAGHTINQTF